jgi:hypothetical protein
MLQCSTISHCYSAHASSLLHCLVIFHYYSAYSFLIATACGAAQSFCKMTEQGAQGCSVILQNDYATTQVRRATRDLVGEGHGSEVAHSSGAWACSSVTGACGSVMRGVRARRVDGWTVGRVHHEKC